MQDLCHVEKLNGCQRRVRERIYFLKHLKSEQAHPSWQLEEDAVLDSIAPDLRVQHGDQAGQGSRSAG